MSQILQIRETLERTKKKRAHIAGKVRQFEKKLKKAQHRLHSATERLVGRAYLAALDEGIRGAPDEILSLARRLAGPREGDALATLAERLTPHAAAQATQGQSEGEAETGLPAYRQDVAQKERAANAPGDEHVGDEAAVPLRGAVPPGAPAIPVPFRRPPGNLHPATGRGLSPSASNETRSPAACQDTSRPTSPS
jgi:hypothetical protein